MKDIVAAEQNKTHFLPILAFKVCRVKGGGSSEQRHFTRCHLDIECSVCTDERLDQLCGGLRHLLHQQNNTLQTSYMLIQI